MLQRTRFLSGIRNLAGVTTEELRALETRGFAASALAENGPGHENPAETKRRFEAGGEVGHGKAGSCETVREAQDGEGGRELESRARRGGEETRLARLQVEPGT